VKIPQKQVEIFAGTGGVGKTTIATARALALTLEGQKVLLITIDPAKRLKQILKMQDQDDGAISTITLDLFGYEKEKSFDAMLMSPRATLQKMAIERDLHSEFDSDIIKTLSRPYGGMNEIMSIIEVQSQLDRNVYDTIILDTPPGKHFIDFLESSEKIKNFFDKSFLEIFDYLGKSISGKGKAKNFITMIVSTGVKKLLSYLEAVTGADFVREFIEAVLALYKCRDSFLRALKFQEELKKVTFSNWFLVTSVEQQKMNEAQDLKLEAAHFLHQDHFLVMNKCLGTFLKDWMPDPNNEALVRLKQSMLKREQDLQDFASHNFSNVLKFHEINHPSPLEHVKELARMFLDQAK
jgi:anion-transporting  ArsA/GET3 family ATPase